MRVLIFGFLLLRGAVSEEHCAAIDDATGNTNFDEDNELLQVNADHASTAATINGMEDSNQGTSSHGSSHDSVSDGVCSIDVGKCAQISTTTTYGPKRVFNGDTLKVGSKSEFSGGCILKDMKGDVPEKEGKSLSGMGFFDSELIPAACPGARKARKPRGPATTATYINQPHRGGAATAAAAATDAAAAATDAAADTIGARRALGFEAEAEAERKAAQNAARVAERRVRKAARAEEKAVEEANRKLEAARKLAEEKAEAHRKFIWPS